MNETARPSFLNDPRGWFHRLFLDEAILGTLLLLCFIGVAYTNFASVRSFRYWLWLVPVFAVAAVLSEWSRHRRHGLPGYRYLLQQGLHWGAVYVAIRLVFALHEAGRLNNDATALTLMTVMSLGTFLAGVYIGWRFMALGLFIAVATTLAAEIEAWLWALALLALAILALGVTLTWREHRRTTGTAT